MVTNVKAIPGLECVQQHRLVVADFRWWIIKKHKKTPKPRLKLKKLLVEENHVKFQRLVKERDTDIKVAQGVEQKWSMMRDTWLKSAEEVCGWTRKGGQHKETWWWNEKVAKAIKQKQDSFNKWKRTGDEVDHQEYVRTKKIARRIVWEAKEEKSSEFAEHLNSKSGQKSFFKIAKNMAKERWDVSDPVCMKNDAGKIVTGSKEQEVWRSYMHQLLNVENEWDGETTASPVQGPRCMLLPSEFREALRKSKQGKAVGPSGVSTELIAASGDTGTEWMADLCNKILDEGKIPEDWKKSTMVPLYKKKGDPLLCCNYRGIKLLEQAMKVFERVIETRVRDQVSIDNMQFGFMPKKGTIDAIFILRQIQEKHLDKKKDIFFAFVDLEKAFDRVPREVVRWALRKAMVDEWLVQAVMALFEGTETMVRTASGDTDSFPVKVGVHQGSVLSPLLFVFVMDIVTRSAKEGLLWEIMYADDLVLLADNERQLQKKDWRLEKMPQQ